MQSDTSDGASEEPPSQTRLDSLKEFRSAGRGFWADVSDSDWNNWRWQLQHRITTVEQLQRLMPTLTPEEYAGARLANHKLALAITPYFFNLIDPADETCPIRWQVIPRLEETLTAPWEMTDPCGEDAHSPVPGLVHRYPDRVLFLVTDRCAAYCRYCTRSRLVSNATGYDFHPEFDRQIHYIREHSEVRDVLLSGGDPLLFSDEKLEYLLSRLRAIPHVEFLRIGTRIPLGNQSVLLRHVNDDVTVMKAQVQKLLMCRVKPYYIYQCDLISGSAHLRASVRKGLEIMEGLRGHTTGYAVPQYVIDAPGGGGKVPINPDHVLSRNSDRVVIRNFEGKVFEYIEAASGAPRYKASENFTAR